jgi:hypothetical protein
MLAAILHAGVYNLHALPKNSVCGKLIEKKIDKKF